jgi:ABC-type glycerol-3-phosphate transport system substrate-binding protein
MMPAFIMGCDAYYVEKDENDYPVIAFTSERFTNACEKIAKFTSSPGIYVTDTTLTIFQSGHALFMGSEIKAAANEMREMPDEFGLLPIPKYDDAQDKYIANMFWATHLLSIPTTCKDSERAAIVMDALNYEANERVMPLYYERVCYKGLRDDDSIEMLKIIRDGRYLNWGLAYGWLDSVEPGVHAQLLAGNGNVASLIKAGSKVVNTLIGKTMKSFE